ncbi:Peptide methionine sulfoxide reductase [Microsporum canis]
MTVIPESPAGGVAVKQQNIPANAQKATFAAGCFWGVEHIYRRRFRNGKGLLDASVGYCGGISKLPTYRQIHDERNQCSVIIWDKLANVSSLPAFCIGTDAEALEVLFDPSLVSYQQLVEFFYSMHDPTTKDRQGSDTGTQYRSAVFAHNDEQLKIAKSITDQVARRWWKAPITTELNPPGKWQWWTAEKYHQLYLEKNPAGFVRDFPPLVSA